MKRAQAHAEFVKVTYLHRRQIERPTRADSPPIYAVVDHRHDGRPRIVSEFVDPNLAEPPIYYEMRVRTRRLNC